MKLTIIDTGCANLSSVRMAVERLGVSPKVSRDAADIRSADKLIRITSYNVCYTKLLRTRDRSAQSRTD